MNSNEYRHALHLPVPQALRKQSVSFAVAKTAKRVHLVCELGICGCDKKKKSWHECPNDCVLIRF